MSKKILVTGGAGYIGSHTAVALAEAGYEPIIIDNFSNSEPRVVERIEEIIGKPVTLYEGDCSDSAFVQNIFEKEKTIIGLIHFAAYKAVGESVEKPLKYYRNNFDSLITLLELMLTHKIPHLVFSSSCTVYGEPDILPVTEATPQKMAESPYGYTKQVCEEMLKSFIRSGAEVKIISLRYFNPIGAHPSALIGELPIGIPANLVPFVTQTAAGIREQLTIFGDDYQTKDGTCIRDYIHVMDLAVAHVKALDYLSSRTKKNFYDIFNVGTGSGNSVMEIVKAFEKVTGLALNYRIGNRRSGDVEKVYANVDKALKELQWKPQYSLEDALRDAWSWQKTLS